MITNEQTSDQIASYASELLRMERPLGVTPELWSKIQSVAGSALTQAPNKSITASQHYTVAAVMKKLEDERKEKEKQQFIKKYFATKR